MGDHSAEVWSDSDKQISWLNLSSAFPYQFDHFEARNDIAVAIWTRMRYDPNLSIEIRFDID